MELPNVNRYVFEPVGPVTMVDVEQGILWQEMGHRVRDLETQETTPGLMVMDDALELCLHMDKTNAWN